MQMQALSLQQINYGLDTVQCARMGGGGFNLRKGPDAPQLSTGMIDVTAACT